MSDTDDHGLDEAPATITPHGAAAAALREPAGDDVRSDQSKVIALSYQRLRRALPAVVGRCMAFSAKARFDASLVAAVNRFYGLEVDVATAESEILEDEDERIRFFPWFLWDWRMDAGASTVGEEFLREAGMDEDVRAIAVGLTQSYIGFYEVLAKRDAMVELADLATGEVVRTPDRALAEDVEPGDIMQARVVRVDALAPAQPGEADGDAALPLTLIDALYVVLPGHAKATVDVELDGVLDGAEDLVEQLKAAVPELLDFADHLMDDLSQPVPSLNADGDELTLCGCAVAPADHAEVRAALLGAAEAVEDPSLAGMWTWRRGTSPIGYVDAVAPDRVRLMANSPRRWRALVEGLQAALGRPLARQLGTVEDFEAAADRWLEGHDSGLWVRADAELREAFEDRVEAWLRRWPDAPLAGLAYRSPREALLAGGQQDVQAELAQVEMTLQELSVGSAADALERVRTELGLAESRTCRG